MNRLWPALRWLLLEVFGVGMFVTGAILGEEHGDLYIVLFVALFIIVVLLVEKFRQLHTA